MTARVLATPLSGLFEIHTPTNGDERGRFTRLFCTTEFAAVRSDLRFVQVNHSITTHRGTVRGMHFQRGGAAEAKLIRCLRGAVFDVAVDLRLSSPTFGHWHGVELSAGNDRELFIPEGFAHGFQALTDNAELLYQHTQPYTPSAEGGILYCDPTLSVEWPLPVTMVSERDAALPCIGRAFAGLAA